MKGQALVFHSTTIGRGKHDVVIHRALLGFPSLAVLNEKLSLALFFVFVKLFQGDKNVCLPFMPAAQQLPITAPFLFSFSFLILIRHASRKKRKKTQKK